MTDGEGRLEGIVSDTYVESQIIMTTVRIVAPFALTYGLFMTFHGADSPGGSFQGGAIIGATILMVAFAFGIEPTRNWIANSVIVALAAGGVVIFTLVGLVPIALGDRFLGYEVYPAVLPFESMKWGLEAIEIGGVALIVAGVFIGLFFAIAAGFIDTEIGEGFGSELRADGGSSTPDATAEGSTDPDDRTDCSEHGGETR